ncbi:MAG TPA: hypothetical protein VGB02_15620 [Pyrinomonadaceae bacterium]|jgi:hypothetical protein
MKKMNYRILFVSSFIYLAFSGIVVFGQCGLPGTPRCFPKQPPPPPPPRCKIKSPKDVITSSANQDEIHKSGSKFMGTLGKQTLFVEYKETEKELIFLIESLKQFSREKTGEVDLYVDLNGNSKIDVSDIRYSLIRDLKNYKLEAYYLSDKDFNSTALVGYSFAPTKIQSCGHPTWSLTIPKTEVYSESGVLNVRLEYRSETCPNCIVRVPVYNIKSRDPIRDENGLFDFGPVKKLKFNL